MAAFSTQPFQAGKHPRAAGGRFQATGAAQAAANGHPTGPWAGGPVRKGSGRNGAPDDRVKAMQRQFNSLGITDEHGRPLREDGINGSHTTAAVKKWQAANGLPATGVVDAKTMVAILADKPQPKKTARSVMSSKPSRRPHRSTSSRPAKKTKPAPPAYVDHGRGFARFGNSAST
jgi:peptidoglycan hydrolase-like protein with peptidoglycan-binding domain